MAATTTVKPFTSEEARRILHHLQQPAVFLNMTCDWPVLLWTAEHLSSRLGDRLVRFRLGRKQKTNAPLFETQCSYVQAQMAQFLSWTQGQGDVGPFSKYPYSEYWAYADYKYIAMLFEDQPGMFEDVKWSDFGFEGRNGRDSTVWIGTNGANTPCHMDTYGCNLVLQVQGRKRWHLFPPEDTPNLYPTRIPYEESSVFSSVNVQSPDLKKFPAFQAAQAHIVTLQPGQVLYVPRHWWHYVESVDPVTVSVNTWIELEVDDFARVSEAVTKMVVWSIKTAESDDNNDSWLNPTEEGSASHSENLQYLNLAVAACAQRPKGLCHAETSSHIRDAHPVKRDSSGQLKSSDSDKNPPSFSVPFGPHLTAVCCQQETPEEDDGISSSRNNVSTSQNHYAPSSEGSLATSAAFEQEKHTCGTGLAPCECAAGTSKNSPEESKRPTISTNDLLACLVHPEIITRVTELLLERHKNHL
ncbi:HSPB1-associated protein 1 homolog [Oryzias melastigma]|uniref:Hspb associated protein 1 n=1 Tax=Oryzias melastigma TaxID=30732 RepID=A0A3B3DND0_ORYME|nr:HSPB1-associated protein 1 homolog [Oryzias melastigma]XP_036065451.1 HSPB1-associated protein 1 homolog [Oryzias melastigma]XP_036065452.1 HSPB1-associated protein 1 homolog [Oryzias melastigma]